MKPLLTAFIFQCFFFLYMLHTLKMFTRKKFVRLIVPVTGAVLLILLRLKVMDSAPPKFQRLDNPAAFANSSFTRVGTTHTELSIQFHKPYLVHADHDIQLYLLFKCLDPCESTLALL